MRKAVALAMLALLAGAALPAAGRADAEQTISGDRGGFSGRIAVDPGTGRGLIAYFVGREFTDVPAAEVVVRPFDRRGAPAGPERTVGTGSGYSYQSTGGPLAIAVDTRRHRYLIAYSAHQPGMAVQEYSQPIIGGMVVARRNADREIFAVLVDADGLPLGAPRRISDTGRPDRTDTVGVAPSVSYDRRSDEFAVVYTSVEDQTRGRLHAARLSAAGAEIGQERPLALRPEPLSTVPESVIAAHPRGGHLVAYTWGDGHNARRLYATRLAARSLSPSRSHLLSPESGAGAGLRTLAWDRRGRTALVTWGVASPGSRAVLSRRLGRDGAPAGPSVRAPAGSIAIPGPNGAGWLFTRAKDVGGSNQQITLQRATRSGRPAGPEIEVSSAARLRDPDAAALHGARSRVLVIWPQVPPSGPDLIPEMKLRRIGPPGG